jgi:hypothetical protein
MSVLECQLLVQLQFVADISKVKIETLRRKKQDVEDCPDGEQIENGMSSFEAVEEFIYGHLQYL